MAEGIIASFEDAQRFLPPHWAPAFSERERALREYLRAGGFVKFGPKDGDGWPLLIYPSSARIQSQLGDAQSKLARARDESDRWGAQLRVMQGRSITDTVMLAAEPLFWEHQLRCIADADYREAVDLVGPPIDMLTKQGWHTRIGLFIKNRDYRDRLVEARSSEVGAHCVTMKEQLRQAVDMKASIARARIAKFSKEIASLEARSAALSCLLSWGKEGGVRKSQG